MCWLWVAFHACICGNGSRWCGWCMAQFLLYENRDSLRVFRGCGWMWLGNGKCKEGQSQRANSVGELSRTLPNCWGTDHTQSSTK